MSKLAVINGGANVMLELRLLCLSLLYCFAHKIHLSVRQTIDRHVWESGSVQDDNGVGGEAPQAAVHSFLEVPEEHRLAAQPLNQAVYGRAKDALRLDVLADHQFNVNNR